MKNGEKKEKRDKKEGILKDKAVKKRKPKIKETHRWLLKKISDGIRKGKTMQEAMLEVGYSETYAKNPNHLRETDSWQELLQERIPDALIVKKINEGLDADRKVNKIVDRDEDGNPIYELVDIPDYGVRHKYVDTSLRVKKKYDDRIKFTYENSRNRLEQVEGEISGELSEIIALMGRKEKDS